MDCTVVPCRPPGGNANWMNGCAGSADLVAGPATAVAPFCAAGFGVLFAWGDAANAQETASVVARAIRIRCVMARHSYMISLRIPPDFTSPDGVGITRAKHPC